MKRIIITFLILIFIPVTSLSKEYEFERELKFEWNLNTDFETNLTDPQNLGTLNFAFGLGVSKTLDIIGIYETFFGRALELGFQSPFSRVLYMHGHEYYHRWVALENGCTGIDIDINFSDGEIKFILEENDDRIISRFAAAGMSWQNLAVEYNIPEVMDRRFTVADHVWILQNQLSVAYYLNHTDSPRSGYGEDGHDIELWIKNTAAEEAAMEDLYSDVKKGFIWQSIGIIQPLWHTAKYLFTGKRDLIPAWWLNPQAELTDAGLMYSLNIYKSFESGLFLKSRIGYGKDRTESDDMYALEVGVSDIPLFWNMRGGVRAGFSDTFDTNYNLGASLTRDFGKYSIGLAGNYYNGYHRESPRVYGSYSEVLFWFALRFW